MSFTVFQREFHILQCFSGVHVFFLHPEFPGVDFDEIFHGFFCLGRRLYLPVKGSRLNAFYGVFQGDNVVIGICAAVCHPFRMETGFVGNTDKIRCRIGVNRLFEIWKRHMEGVSGFLMSDFRFFRQYFLHCAAAGDLFDFHAGWIQNQRVFEYVIEGIVIVVEFIPVGRQASVKSVRNCHAGIGIRMFLIVNSSPGISFSHELGHHRCFGFDGFFLFCVNVEGRNRECTEKCR